MKMASVKDTATFFSNGSASQFKYVLSLYPQALKLKAESKIKKPEELIKLDNWYQNELPKKIKARGKDAHLNHEELVQLMKWKQARGKAYPQLNYLVKVNTPRAVMTETKKAFRKLPNLEQAITALSNLKGVGTTMASALLAAAAPEAAPFMADECLMAIPEIEGIDYTTKEYMNFVQHIRATAERLNSEPVTQNGGGHWNVHQVELALWTHFVASELRPELLEAIPDCNNEGGGGGGKGGGKEGGKESNGKVETGDDEDEVEDVERQNGGKGKEGGCLRRGDGSDEGESSRGGNDEDDEQVSAKKANGQSRRASGDVDVEDTISNDVEDDEEGATSSSSNIMPPHQDDESSSSHTIGQTQDVDDENAQEPPMKKPRSENDTD